MRPHGPAVHARTGRYWNGNLFDGMESSEWWSSGLQLNPELEGGQGVVIEWLVRGEVDIKCVKVRRRGASRSTNYRRSSKVSVCGMEFQAPLVCAGGVSFQYSDRALRSMVC